MLIVAVALLDVSLRRELAYRTDGGAPAFFFVDIQPDQAAPFERLVAAANGGASLEMIPVVRARLRIPQCRGAGQTRPDARKPPVIDDEAERPAG